MAFPILKSMQYCAVGVGRPDYNSLDRYIAAAKDAGVPVVNVGARDKDGVVPYLIKQVGGVRVGIISYGFAPPDQEGLELRKRRYTALKEVREKSDFLVLMDEGSVTDEDWIKRQAERWGAPDAIIGNRLGMSLLAQHRVIGKTWVLPSTPQTKKIGLLEVRIEPGKDPQMNYSQGNLNEADVPEDPVVKKALDDYAAAEIQRAAAQSAAVNQKLGSTAQPAVVTKSGSAGTTTSGVYYDSRTCAPCHKSQYESWAASKHASAVKTLVAKGRDMPACLNCHSERYRQTSAYLPSDQGFKLGVECASCHSRVLPHGPAGPDKSIEGDKIDLNTCRVCHDKEQSPDFEKDHKSYWKRTRHDDVRASQ
ncbi:MAG: multiheme c-type cytochrome [Armatimonadota bacterium]|nr:multiheme c-type cytochrome [Armatimonadota bacterium]